MTKDNWTASVSPVVATTAWAGRADGAAWYNSGNTENIPRTVIQEYMDAVHNQIYIPEGRYSKSQDFARPSGLQELTVNGRKDIWPSWYSVKTSGVEKTKMTFDSITKKLATNCTPAATRVQIEVSKTTDPISKKEIWTVPDGYNKDETDDLHACGETVPTITGTPTAVYSGTTLTVTASVSASAHPDITYDVIVDGTTLKSGTTTGSITVAGTFDTKPSSVEIKIRDAGGYSDQRTISVSGP
jgi:hypothetical protein